MTHRVRTISALTSALSIALLLASVDDADARRVDFEAGVGVIYGVENETPVDDGLYVGIGAAVEINDKFDFEIAAGHAGTEAFTMTGEIGRGDKRDVWHGGLGLRWYPWHAPDSIARFYLASGLSMLTNFKSEGDEELSYYLGPGIRISAGERSGILVRSPLLISTSGETNSVILPTVNWFISF